MAGKVRCKMYVAEVGWTTWGGKVTLQVVSRGEDNKEWASATPSGSLNLTIRNELALEHFKPGQEYFVDIELAPRQGEEGME